MLLWVALVKSFGLLIEGLRDLLLGDLIGDEVDGAEDSGRDGVDEVEVLHLEAVAVFGDEGFVVAGWECGPGVDGGVEDVDFDVILTGFEEGGEVEAVGWVPECADALAVEIDDSGFVDGWVVPGAHAGTGAGAERIGEGCAGGAGGVGVYSEFCAGACEGLAAVDFEEDFRSGWGCEGEVAGVDGFSRVEAGVWVGGPVCEGGLGLGFAGGGEVDLPVSGEIGELGGGGGGARSYVE